MILLKCSIALMWFTLKCVSGQCQVHITFSLLLTCLPTYIHMWPDYGKQTKLSHLLFQRIATDLKNLMVVSKA